MSSGGWRCSRGLGLAGRHQQHRCVWAAAAAENGLLSLLSISLHTQSTNGALNLIRAEPYAFTHGDVRAAHLLALHASIAAANAREAASLARAISTPKRGLTKPHPCSGVGP
jgi:GAF domain-containing protein